MSPSTPQTGPAVPTRYYKPPTPVTSRRPYSIPFLGKLPHSMPHPVDGVFDLSLVIGGKSLKKWPRPAHPSRTWLDPWQAFFLS
jgi:hypothetical protein